MLYVSSLPDCSGVTPVTPSPNTGTIPGWTDYAGSCYIHYVRELVWVDAMRVCNALGARLALIDSQAKNDFLRTL